MQIPLFERGYEKDPAAVAADAIRAAAREKRDVVLVDTAGRMQDNEPLMRSLSKLINQNQRTWCCLWGRRSWATTAWTSS